MIATLVLIYALGAITWLATRGGRGAEAVGGRHTQTAINSVRIKE